MNQTSLEQTTALCRLLGDATRLRLLRLLQHEALTVAELTAVTGLSQSRISTHLGRLREAGLVEDAGDGRNAVADQRDSNANTALWALIDNRLEDPQLAVDLERASEAVRARSVNQGWAESVAGRMERQYSPGRSWEATALALIKLLDLGDVIDIASGDGVLAELLAHRARSVTCIDANAAVVNAGQQRLSAHANVRFDQADMHQLPYSDASFDQVFLMHALTYSEQPQQVLTEAVRVLRPGGSLVLATLAAHTHSATTELYDHVNLGFDEAQIAQLASAARLTLHECRRGAREPKPPYFEVIVAVGTRDS